jgi:hypothetical protein
MLVAQLLLVLISLVLVLRDGHGDRGVHGLKL